MKIKLTGKIKGFASSQHHTLTLSLSGKTPRGVGIDGTLELQLNGEVTRDIKIGQIMTIDLNTDAEAVPGPFDT